MKLEETKKRILYNENWLLSMGACVCAIWLVWLMFLTKDVYLDHDTVHMVEGVLDRVNRPGEDQYLDIYGLNFAPLSVRLLSWMAKWLSGNTLVVVTNLITFCASLLTLCGMYLAYSREFSKQRLVLALMIVSLTPMYGFYAVTFHPYIWALGLFSIALALTSCKSPFLRIMLPILLIPITGLIRKDAILFVPILLERFLGSKKHYRVIWWISMVFPSAVIVYYMFSGNVFVRMFWTLDRLRMLPGVLLKGLGPIAILCIVVVAIRFYRELSQPYLRLVISWALPSLLCYGANPGLPRHLLLVAYATGLSIGLLIPLEHWNIRERCRLRFVCTLVFILLVLGQLFIVGIEINRKADKLRARFDGYASIIYKSERWENLLHVYRWPAGDPKLRFWIVSRSDLPYTLNQMKYSEPETGQYICRIWRFNLSERRKIYVMPRELLEKHDGVRDIVEAVRERTRKQNSESLGEFVTLHDYEVTAIDGFADGRSSH